MWLAQLFSWYRRRTWVSSTAATRLRDYFKAVLTAAGPSHSNTTRIELTPLRTYFKHDWIPLPFAFAICDLGASDSVRRTSRITMMSYSIPPLLLSSMPRMNPIARQDSYTSSSTYLSSSGFALKLQKNMHTAEARFLSALGQKLRKTKRMHKSGKWVGDKDHGKIKQKGRINQNNQLKQPTDSAN